MFFAGVSPPCFGLDAGDVCENAFGVGDDAFFVCADYWDEAVVFKESVELLGGFFVHLAVSVGSEEVGLGGFEVEDDYEAGNEIGDGYGTHVFHLIPYFKEPG